jgi:hypothetical protein
MDLDSLGPRPVDQRPLRIGPQIDDLDLGPGLVRVERRQIGAVIAGEDHDLPARQHAVAVDVGARGRCQHHARPVVVGEEQRALDRALRQHGLFGADLPEALARHGVVALRSQMVGHPLQRGQQIVVVVGGDRGAREQRHLVHRLQPLDRLGDPVGCRNPGDLGRVAEQAAAELRPLVSQDHARPALDAARPAGPPPAISTSQWANCWA